MKEKRVLFLEDDPVSAKKLISELEALDIFVKHFTNGTDCLNHLGSHNNYDLIIVDIQLPDMNGINFIKSYRHIDLTTRVIIVSGSIDRSVFYQTIGLGVEDIIIKPYNLERIKKHL